MTVFTDLAERNARIQRPHVGGPYGEGTIRLPGHDPAPRLAFGIDAVLLDSRNKAKKFHESNDPPDGGQTYPLVVSEDQDRDIGDGIISNSQVIIKFDAPVNNLRCVVIPIVGAAGRSQIDPIIFIEPPTSQVTLEAVLLMTLLKVNLDTVPDPESGLTNFRLEDLTWSLAHAPVKASIDGLTSPLYLDPNNFVKPVSPGKGFPVLGHFSDLDFDGFVLANGFMRTNLNSGSVAPAGHDAGVFYFDTTRQTFGDSGPFTGIHLFFDPEKIAGSDPEPDDGGEFANISAGIPDPKPGDDASFSAERRPFAAHDGHEVVDSEA